MFFLAAEERSRFALLNKVEDKFHGESKQVLGIACRIMFDGYSFSAVGFICCDFLIWHSSLYSEFVGLLVDLLSNFHVRNLVL